MADTEHFFQVRKPGEAKVLPKGQALVFHHTVTHLLFLPARARMDIQRPLSFLITRVN